MPEHRTDMAISDDGQRLIVLDKERYHHHDVRYHAVYE